MPPVLVYHGTPRLYPSDGDGNVAAISFARPVRVTSVRVIPSGVQHPLGVGETDAQPFTAELLLNAAPDSVNAPARTTINVEPAPQALDYVVDMPADTATRLVVIRAPAQRITLSLYAYPDDSDGAATPPTGVTISLPSQLGLPRLESLLTALPGSGGEQRRRILHTLAVLAHSSLFSLEDVLKSPALGVLCSAGDAGDAEATVGLDEAARSVLGLDSSAAVDARASLRALTRLDSPHDAPYPSTTSPFADALALAAAQRDSTHPRAAQALAVTISCIAPLADRPNDPLTEALLARSLPPLAAHAIARGADASLAIPRRHARAVLASLIPVTAEVAVGGFSCAAGTRKLARPFIDALPVDDPVRAAWIIPTPSSTPALASPSPTPSTLAPPVTSAPHSAFSTPGLSSSSMVPSALPVPDPALARALAAPSSSHVITPTPNELLATVAPALLATLTLAQRPPLGLPPSPVPPSGAFGSASAYAGKVYSAHEFRMERDTVSGLGVGLAGVGRKASRHVDEFVG